MRNFPNILSIQINSANRYYSITFQAPFPQGCPGLSNSRNPMLPGQWFPPDLSDAATDSPRSFHTAERG